MIIKTKKLRCTRYFNLIFFLLLLICCEKKEIRKKTFSENLSSALNLKNYKIDTVKINDSITQLKGQNAQFKISGKLLNGKQIGWWTINEKNTDSRINAQYIMIAKNKNFLNQYIVYANNRLLKLGSKFYLTKLSDGKISYIFNMPTKPATKIVMNNFYYGFDLKSKIPVHPRRENNAYYIDVKIPPNAKRIKGYFVQAEKVPSGYALNSIYTVDSIK